MPELRLPNAAPQTRIVSVARIRLDPRNLSELSKGYFATTFLSSSPSLSGRVGVKHFQTAPSIWCRCHSQGPRFSSGSALWPSHDGIRGCGGPIYRGVLAVRLTAGIR